MFQYLGSRGAQQLSCMYKTGQTPFQYLGSRGAQRETHETHETFSSFNTWAREEPNDRCQTSSDCGSAVSILGLARSPTGPFWGQGRHEVFQYLGSRGAQPFHFHDFFRFPNVSILGLARSPTQTKLDGLITIGCFNTWAREEPNSIAVSNQPSDLRFNTWAREEPNHYTPAS